MGVCLRDKISFVVDKAAGQRLIGESMNRLKMVLGLGTQQNKIAFLNKDGKVLVCSGHAYYKIK